MRRLSFNDGLEVDTSGPLRTAILWDSWYVLGDGVLVPVHDQAEGTRLVRDLERCDEVEIHED